MSKKTRILLSVCVTVFIFFSAIFSSESFSQYLSTSIFVSAVAVILINIPWKPRKRAKKITHKDNLVTEINTKVVGVTFDCVFSSQNRQQVLKEVEPWHVISLQPFVYDGQLANYVVLGDGTDIGCLSADLSKELARKYKDCTYKVKILEMTGGGKGEKIGCNIKLSIYKAPSAPTQPEVETDNIA